MTVLIHLSSYIHALTKVLKKYHACIKDKQQQDYTVPLSYCPGRYQLSGRMIGAAHVTMTAGEISPHLTVTPSVIREKQSSHYVSSLQN